MKEAKIFLLDLNPSSNVGSTLGEILSSFPNLGVQLKRESQKESKPAHCVGELCRLLSDCNPDLIFIVLSPDRLAQGRVAEQRQGAAAVRQEQDTDYDGTVDTKELAAGGGRRRHERSPR